MSVAAGTGAKAAGSAASALRLATSPSQARLGFGERLAPSGSQRARWSTSTDGSPSVREVADPSVRAPSATLRAPGSLRPGATVSVSPYTRPVYTGADPLGRT